MNVLGQNHTVLFKLEAYNEIGLAFLIVCDFSWEVHNVEPLNQEKMTKGDSHPAYLLLMS